MPLFRTQLIQRQPAIYLLLFSLNEIYLMYNPVKRNSIVVLPMIVPANETIQNLLLKNVSKVMLMGIEEALIAGAQRAYTASRGMDNGHLPHIVGQLRHFHMNESFHRALTIGDALPTPIHGNRIVTGRSGVFTLARFNIPQGFWINGRRSCTRREMSMANKAIEPLIQPDLFTDYVPPSNAVAFFVSCFSKSLQTQPETPVSIQIAVPDSTMKGWLFKESIEAFIKRYEVEISTQNDSAIPKLKKHVGKQSKDGTSQ